MLYLQPTALLADAVASVGWSGESPLFLWVAPSDMVQRLSPKEYTPYTPRTDADRALPVDSPAFSEIMQDKYPMVDKTDAVADLLTLKASILRLAFSRPRKFGKSLVLDMAAEILAAGRLPEGVQPWYGYNPQPIAMFRGLKVYEKMLASDRLNTAHFVIQVSLDEDASEANRALCSSWLVSLVRVLGQLHAPEFLKLGQSDLRWKVCCAWSRGVYL